jgi:hypothetical protein
MREISDGPALHTELKNLQSRRHELLYQAVVEDDLNAQYDLVDVDERVDHLEVELAVRAREREEDGRARASLCLGSRTRSAALGRRVRGRSRAARRAPHRATGSRRSGVASRAGPDDEADPEPPAPALGVERYSTTGAGR